MISDWGEVVTRYPYGNVRMDHLLSKENKSFSILLVMFLVIKECRMHDYNYKTQRVVLWNISKAEHWKLYSRTNKKKINSNNFLELAVKKID